MDYLLGLLLLVVVVATLAYPLYRPRRREGFLWQGAETVSDLLVQRDSLYVTLRDLQQDYEMGKLSPADYQSLQARYMARTVAVLQRLDAIQVQSTRPEDELNRSIESEVAALRGARVRPHEPRPVLAGADALAGGQAQSEASVQFCRQCGQRVEPDDRFCARCGAQL